MFIQNSMPVLGFSGVNHCNQGGESKLLGGVNISTTQLIIPCRMQNTGRMFQLAGLVSGYDFLGLVPSAVIVLQIAVQDSQSDLFEGNNAVCNREEESKRIFVMYFGKTVK